MQIKIKNKIEKRNKQTRNILRKKSMLMCKQKFTEKGWTERNIIVDVRTRICNARRKKCEHTQTNTHKIKFKMNMDVFVFGFGSLFSFFLLLIAMKFSVLATV